MDGDGVHPPQYIPGMLRMLDRGCHVVLGTRCSIPFFRNPLLSLLYSIYLPILCILFRLAGMKSRGSPLTGFRCMRRSTWNLINPQSDNFLFEAEQQLRSVFKMNIVKMVPFSSPYEPIFFEGFDDLPGRMPSL